MAFIFALSAGLCYAVASVFQHKVAAAAPEHMSLRPSRNQYFVTLCLRAIDLLSPLWEAVLWVADELYQFGEVSGSRVREIVAACSKPRRV